MNIIVATYCIIYYMDVNFEFEKRNKNDIDLKVEVVRKQSN